jgi:hypothetical protein
MRSFVKRGAKSCMHAESPHYRLDLERLWASERENSWKCVIGVYMRLSGCLIVFIYPSNSP